MSVPSKFKVCPDDLPPLPTYKELCAEGCFLFHRDDEIAARHNKERVLLIPKLEFEIEELTDVLFKVANQRDRKGRDVDKFKELAEGALSQVVVKNAQIEELYTTGDVVLTFGAGVGAGAAAAAVAIFVMKFLL